MLAYQISRLVAVAMRSVQKVARPTTAAELVASVAAFVAQQLVGGRRHAIVSVGLSVIRDALSAGASRVEAEGVAGCLCLNARDLVFRPSSARKVAHQRVRIPSLNY